MHKNYKKISIADWQVAVTGGKLIVGAMLNTEFNSIHHVAFTLANSDSLNDLISIKDLEGINFTALEVDVATIA